MKKIILLIIIMLGNMMVFAQTTTNKKEVKALQSFLTQPSADGRTNAQALELILNDAGIWPGVTWTNGHVTAIEWKDKKLAGKLDVTALPELAKLDVSRNKITSLNAQGCAKLADLNASRNMLTFLDVNNCTALSKLTIYKNRLLDLNLVGTP